MTPEDIINKVICGDALTELKKLPNNFAKLIITSPPYNMGGKSLGYQPRSKISDKHYDVYCDDLPPEEYKEKMFEIINLCIKKSKYTFWNMQMLVSTKDFIVDMLSNFRSNFKDIFVWHKIAVSQIINKQTNQPVRMATGFEFVFIFGKDNTRNFTDVNFPANNYVPNIKKFHHKENFAEHHATFPLELPEYFIQHFSFRDDIILDPFNGTGTTCVAAKQLGRKYVGIEISEKYCKIAEARLRQEILL